MLSMKLPRFPVEASTVSVIPTSLREVTVIDACRSLKEFVGFCRSSLIYRLVSPNIIPNLWP